MYRIESIGPLGSMNIKFSEDMNTAFSKQFLNETFIQIYVQPSSPNKELKRNLALTWEVQSFNAATLEIQLHFEDAK